MKALHIGRWFLLLSLFWGVLGAPGNIAAASLSHSEELNSVYSSVWLPLVVRLTAPNSVDYSTEKFEQPALIPVQQGGSGGTVLSASGQTTFTEGSAPILIAPNLLITTATQVNLDSASIAIGNGFLPAQDRLGVYGQSGTSGTYGTINWAYNAISGVMSLTGTATLTTYQNLMRQITYNNLSHYPSTVSRSVTFMIGTNSYYAGTGHFYEYVSAAAITWSNAETAAAGRRYLGLQGYLVTLASAGENAFASSQLRGVAWIGANDTGTEGTWRWVVGPETGTNFCTGANPCNPVSGRYANWNSAEPNNSGGNEDYAHMIYTPTVGPRGAWNDLGNAGGSGDYSTGGYLVEYGGLASDPYTVFSGTVTVNVVGTNELALSKKAEDLNGAPLYARDWIRYTLYVTNTNPTDSMTDIILTDTLPAGMNLIEAAPAGYTGSAALTWNVGTLAAGAVWTGVVTMSTAATATMIGGNIAAVSCPSDTLQQTSPIFSGGSGVVERGLVMTKDADDLNGMPLYSGDIIRYTLRVTNTHATLSQTNISLVDALPMGLILLGASPAGISTTNAFTWDIGTLAPGAVWTGILTMTTDGVSSAISGNLALLTSEQQYPQSIGPVWPAGGGNILFGVGIQKVAEDLNGGELHLGDRVRYTIHISNTSATITQTNVRVQDMLPAGLALESAAPAGFTGTQPLIWNLGTLGPGAQWTGTLTMTVDGSASVIGGNLAEVSSDQQNPLSVGPILPPGGGNIVPWADLWIGIQSPPSGSILTYTVNVGNYGPISVAGALVSNTLPAQLTGALWVCEAGAGAACTASGGGKLSDTVTLPVNGLITYTLWGTAPSGLGLFNTVEVQPPAGMDDSVLTNNQRTAHVLHQLYLPLVLRNKAN